MNECEWMCLLNEEPVSGTICLTEATIDDEIVSEKRSTCVCPAPRSPSPTSNKHAHMKPPMVAPFDPISAPPIRHNQHRWEIYVKPIWV